MQPSFLGIWEVLGIFDGGGASRRLARPSGRALFETALCYADKVRENVILLGKYANIRGAPFEVGFW